MLTKEQIKNLKRGDEICIKVLFDSLCVDRIQFKIPDFPNDYFLPPAKPKYDPCRKFKKGDKVRIVEWNGRIPQYLADCIGSEHTVSYDEDINGGVHIEGAIDRTLACYLELVTPVEERDLYFVLDSPRTFNICKRDGGKFAATFDKYQPLAREHAEKYCAALNAEHRKEQK